jgi:hypothetical protein
MAVRLHGRARVSRAASPPQGLARISNEAFRQNIADPFSPRHGRIAGRAAQLISGEDGVVLVV